MARKKTTTGSTKAPSGKTSPRAGSAGKKTTSRSAAAKAPVKKSPPKKTTSKKTPAKKTPAKKAPTKKTTSKKAPVKSTAKKTPAKKSTSKKAPVKTAPTKKTTSKKTTSKKAPVKKAPATKTTSKKTTSKKTTSKKAPVKKAPASKTTSKKTPVSKKPVTKKTASKSAPAKKKTGGRRKLGAQSVAEAASSVQADAQGYVFINGRRVRMISTGGIGIKKKTRSAASRAVAPPEVEVAPRKVKTTLAIKVLNQFKKLLLLRRAEIVGDLNSMQQAALDSGIDSVTKLPVHMADVGSDAYSQDLNIGLAEWERERLKEIDDALRRIAAKTYGMCEETGEEIPLARLEAKPWAKLTIEAKRRTESGWR